MAIQHLKSTADSLDEDSEEHKKISFITEQLKLLSKKKYGRVYSAKLVILSYLIHAASPAAYVVLRDQNLSLPTTTTLRKVTRRLNRARWICCFNVALFHGEVGG